MDEYESEEYESECIIPTYTVNDPRVLRGINIEDGIKQSEYESKVEINAATITRYMMITRSNFDYEISKLRESDFKTKCQLDEIANKERKLYVRLDEMQQKMDDQQQTIDYLRNEIDELKRSTVNNNQMEKMSETIRWITNGY